MRIIVKLICFLLAVVLLICTAACNHAPIDPLEGIITEAETDPLEGIITETEYNEIKVYIDELAKEKELDLMAYSGYCYFFEREYSDNLCQVGYKGLPVLLTEIDKRLDVDTIIDVHTHPFGSGMPFFSGVDTDDEKNMKLYLVEKGNDIHYASIVFSRDMYNARLWKYDGKKAYWENAFIKTQKISENIL